MVAPEVELESLTDCDELYVPTAGVIAGADAVGSLMVSVKLLLVLAANEPDPP
jgi:hypothetical protein